MACSIEAVWLSACCLLAAAFLAALVDAVSCLGFHTEHTLTLVTRNDWLISSHPL